MRVADVTGIRNRSASEVVPFTAFALFGFLKSLREETTALGIPRIMVCENTERAITLTDGINVMVGGDPAQIVKAAFRMLDSK